MSKLKKMVCLIGLAISIAPTNALSNQQVDEFMEVDIQTRTEEIKLEETEEVELVSTHAEFIPVEVEEESNKKDSREYIGKFTITHYCSCDSCNYPWGGYPAANGEKMKVGYTVAVDPKIIPLNTIIEIDGYGVRKAQDTGGRIKGNKIDVLVSNHKEAYKFGVKKNVDVWIPKE